MEIDFIGAPYTLGCGRDGAQFAPDAIRKYLINFPQVKDHGDVLFETPLSNDPFFLNPNIKYLKELLIFNERLAEKVSAVLNSGGFPLIFGGDHSIALGSISATATAVDNLGIIWVDAHCDLNTDSSSLSKNAHGMPLASLLGLGDSRMVNLFSEQIKIKPESVILIGQRSFDSPEWGVIKDLGVNLFDMYNIRKNGIESLLEKAKNIFAKNGVTNVHLSFDVDSIDPLYAPGTGTPVEEGLSLPQFYAVMDFLFRDYKVCSMDMVEVNPLLDIEDKTTKLCLEIIRKLAIYNEV